jgi:hypothetical protein
VDARDSTVYHRRESPSEAEWDESHLYDCYKKNPALTEDDTLIMFMIMLPLNETEQLVVTQKKGAVKKVWRGTIKVSAQYKIVNTLVTVDAN